MRKGLGFHNRHSAGGGFSPASLFTGGVQGAWYDPSDLTTLFTDRAGTTPCGTPGGGSVVPVGRMLDKSGNGNYATAANDTTARPELSARVNLLTYSEQFNNAAWVATNATKGTTTGTRPDGTTGTVHSLTLQGATTSYVYQTNSFAPGQTATFAIYVRLPSGSTATDVRLTTNNNLAWNTGISQKFALTSSWQRLLLSGTVTTTGTVVNVIVGNTDAAGNRDASIPAGVIEIWGADLRPANIGTTIPAYQRISDADTYDNVGFPRYLRFDGVDDAMSTPANVNLSGTDKATVFAGVRKQSDAAAGVLTEFTADINGNNGSFIVTAPSGAGGANYLFGSKGTIRVDATGTATFAAPVSSVVCGIGDIAGDVATLRVNGSQNATNAANQGTGNYANAALFIGARNNASLFLNGNIYSLIVVGSAVSAGQISATEQWVAQRTGIVL